MSGLQLKEEMVMGRFKTDRKFTTWFMVISIIVLIGYDIWAFASENDSTISVVVWLNSYLDFKSLPVIFTGMLIGHLFFPPYPREEIK